MLQWGLRRCPPSPAAILPSTTARAWDLGQEGLLTLPKQLDTREEIRYWARARKYRDQAISYLKLARMTTDPDTQNRFIKIAQHYCALADAEERDAESKGC
jgi:hypothetical protein